MSQGMGAIQRRALDVLSEAGKMVDSIEIAGRIFDQSEVSPAEAVSVRRALRSLAKAGHITDLGRSWHSGRRMWALPEHAAAYQERVRQVFGA